MVVYRKVFNEPPDVIRRPEATPFLTRPPADTRVLIGYVKSREHLEWILALGCTTCVVTRELGALKSAARNWRRSSLYSMGQASPKRMN